MSVLQSTSSLVLTRVEPRPEWRECVVAATGPSLTEDVAEACAGRRVIAVNDAYRRIAAEVLFACDGEWWDVHRGAPDFLGEKWSTHDPNHNDKRERGPRYGLNVVRGVMGDGFSLDPGVIHYGNSSGFQAINLAILFGARRIILVGFDMRTTTPRHFFGDHPEGLKNSAKYEHFIPAFNNAAKMLPPEIRIVNATPGSALRCFPMMGLSEALA